MNQAKRKGTLHQARAQKVASTRQIGEKVVNILVISKRNHTNDNNKTTGDEERIIRDSSREREVMNSSADRGEVMVRESRACLPAIEGISK